VGGVSKAIGKLFGFEQPKLPKPPKPLPAPEVPTPEEQADAGEAGAADERQRLRRLRGINSTILTSPFGAQDPAATERKTLLGS